jgi:hypothetical protein
MKFFRDSRATRLRPALKHQRLISRFGKIESANQPIVAPANDDDVAVGPELDLGHQAAPL